MESKREQSEERFISILDQLEAFQRFFWDSPKIKNYSCPILHSQMHALIFLHQSETGCSKFCNITKVKGCPRHLFYMWVKGQILVKCNSKVAHCGTRSQGNAIYSKCNKQFLPEAFRSKDINFSLSEFRGKKFWVIQVFMSLRHACSLTNWLV